MKISNTLFRSIVEAFNAIPNKRDVTSLGESSYDLASKLGQALDAIPCFLNGDNDQPTTCPECGSRTDFVELTRWRQLHTCLNPQCRQDFVLEFDEEEEG